MACASVGVVMLSVWASTDIDNRHIKTSRIFFFMVLCGDFFWDAKVVIFFLLYLLSFIKNQILNE